jgi:type II restriction enzyme
VISKVSRSSGLEIGDMNSRGWLMDILNCVNRIPAQVFALNEIYAFEEELKNKHPDNNNIKPKIRQQLQFLRDRGFLEFLGSGRYRKTT